MSLENLLALDYQANIIIKLLPISIELNYNKLAINTTSVYGCLQYNY